MKTRPFLLHALSPLHAGTGHAADVIDLPIARMKATGIPIVPGSSIKGVLRDACRQVDYERTEAVFGPSDDPAAHAGALIVGDARLLALPVRSFRGTFTWVSSPLLLRLAKRDLVASELPVPHMAGRSAQVASENVCVYQKRLYLEDIDLPAESSADVKTWAQRLAALAALEDDLFTRRFVVVDDDTLTFLWETATQVDARVRLDDATRTVAQGALWLEESLPPETLLIGLLAADRSRRPETEMTPDAVLDFALPKETILQFGGKATIGRGRCRIIPV
ncbi:type III-B CRISPR module RAMP protein Cmr4 [Chloracidobacterium thermophilum]|uniref:CRISPR-associated RAMP protein, Cmr4 family n=1 Tax=Chloracidobacterium thermophilum (strain B) TaxID=981222 RepID=G2LGI6_CHLTF|nr:type III-B CRISPR module RAMP protein Cmr4 [Chloracidobacterium thermophilum]AEP10946.1 CRISPR-associated RAMP protein, Cmr4 family [Chloracidobacterium thermophilum B]QUV78872.1 type III-B CRISPR module RAMP protein Cmr4 [Chloracidobacterium thermophilum]